MRPSIPTLVLAACLSFAMPQVHAKAPEAPKDTQPRKAAAGQRLAFANKPWTGDFDKMLERRIIRVYAPYSRSLYFVDKGRERGLEAELVRDFERWVNSKYAKQLGKRPVTVYIIAANRGTMLTELRDGMADIAVGNLTVTEDREKLIDFVAPDEGGVNTEILVNGPVAPPVPTVEDLSGRTVHVRKSSSYYGSLVALNERLEKAGKPPVDLVLVPDALEDEDMLEMLNSALLQSIVVDEWKARLWAQVLPRVKVRSDIVLRPPTKKGWAVREDSPKLQAALHDFYKSWVKKSGVIPYRQKQYMATIKLLHNPSDDADEKRFQETISLFEKYGKQYGFDPLMLAAQGYQESMLDQRKRSSAGAIGVMQIMPATGASLKVGNIKVTEPNIHGGAKYMNHLMTQYFQDAKFDDQNRTLFAFASYNAGPTNIQKMRTEAARRKLDPNLWFANVELVTAEKIGIETTTYVRNIFKYYVSYKLTQDAKAHALRMRRQVDTPGKQDR